MRVASILAWISGLALGCGGSPAPRESEEPEPAWAATYHELVEKACACSDDACVRAAKVRTDEYLVARGGIEAAPPSVHDHRARLEECFLQRSEDLPRDVTAAAERICACASTECVVTWQNDLDALAGKYRAANVAALEAALEATIDQEATARLQWRRASECFSKVTISGDDYLRIIEENNAELCACATRECAEAAQAKAMAKLEGILTVATSPEQDAPIHAAKLARCKCEKRFPPRQKLDVELKVAGIPARLQGDITFAIDCPE